VDRLAGAGFEIRRLPVGPDGASRVDRLAEMIDASTRLVCLMLANNETGVLQPVDQAAEICRRAGVWLHCDAVQAAGKLPVDFAALGATSLSLGAHKFNGPRGIGALIVRAGVPLSPLLHGGAQQFAKRPGTEDVALAMGMRTALSGWADQGESRRQGMQQLRERFEERLRSQVDDVVIICRGSNRLPQTSLVSFPGLNRQAIFMAADLRGLAISIGSACASGSSEPSVTLRAMGLPAPIVDGAVRISFGFQTRADELDFAADQLAAIAVSLGRKQPASSGARPSRPD
jgi:cysteine desulfurase